MVVAATFQRVGAASAGRIRPRISAPSAIIACQKEFQYQACPMFSTRKENDKGAAGRVHDPGDHQPPWVGQHARGRADPAGLCRRDEPLVPLGTVARTRGVMPHCSLL
jgi:hypothetical protein